VTKPPQVRIETISSDGVADLARMHIDAFPDSALSALGETVVARYYCFRFDVSTRLVALGAWENDRLVGFVVAGTFAEGWKRFVRRYWPMLALSVLRRPWIAFRPRLRSAAATVAGWLFPRVRQDQAVVAPGSVGVMSIGVAPHARTRGIGAELMRAVEERLSAEGVHSMHLSVRNDNIEAIRFYEGLGWRPAGRSSAEALLMQKSLGTGPRDLGRREG
jgi:ribosomal protein S18 acetylase RimI-like enzyme